MCQCALYRTLYPCVYISATLLLVLHCPHQCYTVVIGKMSVEKLANFGEVDVFVLVACREASLVDAVVRQHVFSCVAAFVVTSLLVLVLCTPML